MASEVQKPRLSVYFDSTWDVQDATSQPKWIGGTFQSRNGKRGSKTPPISVFRFYLGCARCYIPTQVDRRDFPVPQWQARFKNPAYQCISILPGMCKMLHPNPSG